MFSTVPLDAKSKAEIAPARMKPNDNRGRDDRGASAR